MNRAAFGVAAILSACASSQVPVADATATPSVTPQPRGVLDVPAEMWFCFGFARPATGLCYADAATCEARRGEIDASGPECVETRRVACFSFLDRLDEERVTVCSPSFEGCEELRGSYSTTHTSDWVDYSACQGLR